MTLTVHKIEARNALEEFRILCCPLCHLVSLRLHAEGFRSSLRQAAIGSAPLAQVQKLSKQETHCQGPNSAPSKATMPAQPCDVRVQSGPSLALNSTAKMVV